jgi:hypothetical protein
MKRLVVLMTLSLILLGLILTGAVCDGGTTTVTVNLPTKQETYLGSASPDVVRPPIPGVGPDLFPCGVGYGTHRDLFQFDFANIPAGSTIKRAEMILFVYKVYGGSESYRAHRINKSWDEATATWNSSAGDFDPTPADTKTITGIGGIWVSWDITALVQAWLDAPTRDFGVMVRSPEEANGGYVLFASSDYMDFSHHPQVKVTYISP